MILIVSEVFDPSTDKVVSWLKKKNQKVIRINSLNEFIDGGLNIDSSSSFNGSSIKGVRISDIKSVWFRRRPEFSNKDRLVRHSSESFKSLVSEMNSSLIYEELIVNNFLEILLSKSKVIGDVKNSSLNKLYQLRIAQDLGMRIPDTRVLTHKTEIEAFALVHDRIIIKPLNNIAFVRFPGFTCSTYTKLVDEDIMARIPKKFSPALFQECIDKEFEIRSFFLNDQEYSMAIFSQKNDQTKIDFRKYDKIYPNRRVPFKLPKTLAEIVKKFMKTVGINTGSFDFIYSSKGEYIFLEVNPVGQFGMVSAPCNYFVEKQIANQLSHEN